MTSIEQIQTALGVRVDGQWGPESEAALRKAIRRSQEGPPVPPARPGAMHPFIVVAREWLGVRESSRNRFEGDRKVWADTSYPNGWEDRQPYCAAFQCHVAAEARRRGAKVAALPTSASVSEVRNWARARGYAVAKPQPGDMGTLLPSGTSHIFLVESVHDGYVTTLEANTDGEGSQEGDGFWRKTRLLSKCDFFRIPVAT